MNEKVELPIEQEFKIHSLKEWIKSAPEEEVKRRLVDIYIHSMHKENLYKAELKKVWGLDNLPPHSF
jgi:hypothetical protein